MTDFLQTPMPRTNLVSFLRWVYFLYLTLLPMLATAGLGMLGLRPYQAIPALVFLGVFLAGIVYFGVMAELVPFPFQLRQALAATFLTPLQVFLAVILSGENLWLFFVYDFVVEGIGMLAGVLFYATVMERAHGIKSIIVGFLLLGIPVVCLGYVYVPPIIASADNSWFTLLFLTTGVVSSVLTVIQRIKTGARNTDTWGLIILGLLAWPIGGVFIPEIIRNLKQMFI